MPLFMVQFIALMYALTSGSDLFFTMALKIGMNRISCLVWLAFLVGERLFTSVDTGLQKRGLFLIQKTEGYKIFSDPYMDQR